VPAQPLSLIAPAEAIQPPPIRVAMGSFYLSTTSGQEALDTEFALQVTSQVKVALQNYGGLAVVEDQNYTDAIQQILSQQFLDDLSRGREPGLPLGTLRGVDYLIFGMLENFSIAEVGHQTQSLFGIEFFSETPNVLQLDATVYLVDVVTGEYAAASNVAVDLPFAGDNLERFLNSEIGVAFGNELTAQLLREIRPLAVLTTVNDTVVLNHKNSIGLKVGDRFEVYSNGQSVVDPSTNTVFSNVGSTRIAEIEITAFEPSGWAHARVVEGEMPSAGDLIIPSQELMADADETQNPRQLIF
jgi:hypothetical protein